jgi:hypothetical protein
MSGQQTVASMDKTKALDLAEMSVLSLAAERVRRMVALLVERRGAKWVSLSVDVLAVTMDGTMVVLWAVSMAVETDYK